jgi:hypothetical protein
MTTVATTASPTTLRLSLPNLSAMLSEILQPIFWRTLELSLCLVSKRLYLELPSYRRLTRFLPLFAFGSEELTDKIAQNDGTTGLTS